MTSWHYACGSRHGTLLTATERGRTSLADAVSTPAVPGHADGRAVLATLFDRLASVMSGTDPQGESMWRVYAVGSAVKCKPCL